MRVVFCSRTTQRDRVVTFCGAPYRRRLTTPVMRLRHVRSPTGRAYTCPSVSSKTTRRGAVKSGGGHMSFPIVGIGASAGGLEAISELLAALPSQNGMAFVIVQHLGPDHESLLTELLGKRTPMPVAQAEEGIVIEPEHVYVIPPNATLTVSDQRLHLATRP